MNSPAPPARRPRDPRRAGGETPACGLRCWLALLVLPLVAGCATNPLASARFWSVESCAAAPAARIRFAHPGETPLAVVDRAACETLQSAATRIQAQSGYAVHRVLISDLADVNAFASTDGASRPVIVVNLGMLSAIGADEDAWAGLLGHEVAHLVRRHREGREEARAGAQATGQALGQVIAQFIPGMGGFLAGNAANFVTANAMYGAYTRPQEAEADEYGLKWMHAAGYDPRGMVRLFTVLRGSGGAMPAFVSTHPGSYERVQAAEDFAAKHPPVPKPAAKPCAPGDARAGSGCKD